MMLHHLLRVGFLPALLLGPLALGLPVGSGVAFAGGALVGVALVMPLAIALRLLSLRALFGWPVWLLRVVIGR